MGSRRWISPRFSVSLVLSSVAAIANLSWCEAEEPAAPEDSVARAGVEAPRYHLPPVVVTASRIPTRLDRVPQDVSVIARDRLDATRPFFLSDALREVAAIDMQRSGGLGKLTDVRLRGADPRHTLVLFDGIPLNGPWLGSFDFADLMDPGIERVEVAGGPASSLYGSGAVGGVIQILSGAGAPGTGGRDGGAGDGGAGDGGAGDGGAGDGGDGADGGDGGAGYGGALRVRAFAEAGEDQTLRQGAAWSGVVGGAAAGLAGTHLTSDGSSDRDGYEGWNANGSASARLADRHRLAVSVLGTDGEKELPYDFFFDPTDFTLKQVLDPNIEERDRLLAGRATWTFSAASGLALEGEVGGLSGRIDYDNDPGAVTSDFQHTDLRNARRIATARARVVPEGGPIHAVLGAEYRADDVDRDDRFSFGGFGDTTRVEETIHERSLFAQAHAELMSRILLDAGLRVDDHSRYGAYGVPRVALGYDWREMGLKVRGGYGRAFTAPTLTDLYYPGYGSTSLRPERSTTWEAGADGRWLGGRLEGKATFHSTEFKDLIQSNSFFQAENIGEARIEGETYEIRVRPSGRVSMTGTAAHLVAKKLSTSDPDPDRRLPKRPAWRFGVSGELRPLEPITLTGAWRWVDSVRDPFVFEDVNGNLLDGDTPGYATFDVGAIASLARWVPFDVSVRVMNALDRAYSEVKGFPALGRTVTAGLTFVKTGR